MPKADASRRVLIADDAAGARDLICSILRPSGYEVVEAADGEEALAYAIRFRPDLVILDLQIAKLDGCSVAATLRNTASLEGMPILALSAWISQTDPAMLAQAGFSKCLPKPINPAKLRSVIQDLFAAAGTQNVT